MATLRSRWTAFVVPEGQASFRGRLRARVEEGTFPAVSAACRRAKKPADFARRLHVLFLERRFVLRGRRLGLPGPRGRQHQRGGDHGGGKKGPKDEKGRPLEYGGCDDDDDDEDDDGGCGEKETPLVTSAVSVKVSFPDQKNLPS